ncbi:MAG: GIN domain-containing protein [Bacteroidia bacterium]
MKKIILAGSIAILSIVAIAQNKVSIPNFNKMVISSNFDIKLVKSDSNFLAFKESDLKKFSSSYLEKGFKVNNNTLTFDLSEFNAAIPVNITVYSNNLQELKLEGNAKLEMGNDSIFKTNSFKIYADGATKSDLYLDVEKLEAQINGASKLTLDGKVTEGKLEATGASKINAIGMAFENLNVEANGASKVSATVKNNLKAEASGVSKIEFAGNPKNVDKNLSGASKIDKVNGEDVEDGHVTGEISVQSKNKNKHKKHSNKMTEAFGGIEIGVGTFVTPNMNTTLDNSNKNLETNLGSSWRFALNFGDWDLPIVKGRLALTTGLGFSFDHYGFKNKDTLMNGENTKTLEFKATDATLSTSRLSQFNLTMPLLIKYNSSYNKKDNRFYFATGIILNYTVGNSIYTEYSNKGVEYEKRYTSDFFVNKFRADATVRIGYNHTSVFANFGLVPMFDTAKVTDTRTMQAGLAFNF